MPTPPTTTAPLPDLRKRLRGVAARTVPFLGALTGVDTDEPVVALTFDDGPDPRSTPQVLDLLADHRAHATFFVLGERAIAWPGLVNRAVDEGHCVGTHGWEHRSLVLDAPGGVLTRARWRRDLIARGAASLGYAHTRLYRPAYGHRNLGVQLAARTVGHEVVGWSVSAGDWADEGPDIIAERVLTGIKPGAIVVFHDALADAYDPSYFDRSSSLAAVALVLEALTGRYRCVTVPELLRRGVPRRRYFYPAPTPDPRPLLPEIAPATVGTR